MSKLSDYEIKQIIEKWTTNKYTYPIINPITNRIIKKDGLIYKNIDEKYKELLNNKLELLKKENEGSDIIKKEDKIITYDNINLDINIKYIINKIKIVPIPDLSIIFNYTNNFNLNRFIFDENKNNYELINIKSLSVGILGTEIEDTFPKNINSKYACIIQYPKDFNIIDKKLNEINCVFCLLCVEKENIDNHDEQEIALYLFTLQYWNHLLDNYRKYGWINPFFAIIKKDKECFIYTLKIEENNMKKFINNCKIYKYDFEDIIIEKCKLEKEDQIQLIKYLGFGIFDLFNHPIFI